MASDNMAGYMMSQGESDAVVVGTDRVAANCNVVNKIGTYMVTALITEKGIVAQPNRQSVAAPF